MGRGTVGVLAETGVQRREHEAYDADCCGPAFLRFVFIRCRTTFIVDMVNEGKRRCSQAIAPTKIVDLNNISYNTVYTEVFVHTHSLCVPHGRNALSYCLQS